MGVEGAALPNSLEAADLTNNALLAEVVAVIAGLTLVVSWSGLEWTSREASVGEAWDFNADAIVLIAFKVSGDTWGSLRDSGALVDWWWSIGEGSSSSNEKSGDGEELHFDYLRGVVSKCLPLGEEKRRTCG